jgi:hypothetical protein
MPQADTRISTPDPQLTGTAREFAEFCKGERNRRSNAEEAFDPALFDEAVAYVLRQLTARSQEMGT